MMIKSLHPPKAGDLKLCSEYLRGPWKLISNLSIRSVASKPLLIIYSDARPCLSKSLFQIPEFTQGTNRPKYPSPVDELGALEQSSQILPRFTENARIRSNCMTWSGRTVWCLLFQGFCRGPRNRSWRWAVWLPLLSLPTYLARGCAPLLSNIDAELRRWPLRWFACQC